MKLGLIGSGGREHALLKALTKNKDVEKVYAIPGNGGMSEAECVDIKATDIEGIVKFCVEKKLDYVVVAPDDPLVMGLIDALESKGIKCFGPNAKAAIIEGSKVFSKNLMKKYGIPTAAYETFNGYNEAIAYASKANYPLVIKADGLALGKGVVITQSVDEAKEAIGSMMLDHKFGKSGDNLVIEEFLEGPEVSVLAFTDGKTVVPMVSSMDHKKAHDNDEGLNTGGMGTIAPNPYYTEDVSKRCMEEIFLPTINAMNKEGRTFKGCLYFGLMICKDGPKVIEYNCRFGDPEAQVVLPLLDSDLLTVMQAVSDERLGEIEVRFRKENACCVIMASNGYPTSYEKGFEITYPDDDKDNIYFAGVKKENDKLLTNGGRVLGAYACGSTLKEAIENAYKVVNEIKFENAYYRKDIGQRALKKES